MITKVLISHDNHSNLCMQMKKIFKSMRLVCVIYVPSYHLWLDTVIAWGSIQGTYRWNPLLCWALLLGHWIALCDLLLMIVSQAQLSRTCSLVQPGTGHRPGVLFHFRHIRLYCLAGIALE